MSKLPECYGIIPARYDSSRFPGKPLADICGKPMIWHVYNQACKCTYFKKNILATDDERIFSAAESYDIPVVMTKKDHPSGSDRVLEAAEILNIPDDAVVVNIQGDEPLIDPLMLLELVKPFEDSDISVTTLANVIDSDEAANPNRVKAVLSTTGRALYFSRSLIPYPRDTKTVDYYGHIGLYAFRMKALKHFVSLDTGELENTEKLEQLRLLENDIPIHVVLTEHKSVGVDTPEDLENVISLLNSKKR